MCALAATCRCSAAGSVDRSSPGAAGGPGVNGLVCADGRAAERAGPAGQRARLGGRRGVIFAGGHRTGAPKGNPDGKRGWQWV